MARGSTAVTHPPRSWPSTSRHVRAAEAFVALGELLTNPHDESVSPYLRFALFCLRFGHLFFFLCVFGYKAESLDRCHLQRKRTIFMTYKAIKEGMAEGEGKGEEKLREREWGRGSSQINKHAQTYEQGWSASESYNSWLRWILLPSYSLSLTFLNLYLSHSVCLPVFRLSVCIPTYLLVYLYLFATVTVIVVSLTNCATVFAFYLNVDSSVQLWMQF